MDEPRKRSDKKKSKQSKDLDDAHVSVSVSESEERRLKKELKRAKKMGERLAELGLDENGEPLDNFSLLKYPVREWKISIPGSRGDQVAFNPVVTMVGMIGLWILVMFCTFESKESTATLASFLTNFTLKFSWMLFGSRAILFFFILYIAYRYGHVHLGKKNDKPEFSTLSYFCMIFAADAGPRFLSYQVLEPMTHRYTNFFANSGYRSQDEIDMFAINMTVTHWGIVSWTHYTVVALAMSLAGQRFNLPMTFRSCFYPIFRDYTWGWMGDLIDALAIMVTMATVCTMLSMTAEQNIIGLMYMGIIDEKSTESEIQAWQNVTVWVITVVSTASVISGLRGGIQYVSVIAMAFGFLLAFLIFVMDDTKFLLNLQVQEVGYYLQNSVFNLNFWTDAFGQLRDGSGRAIDGKSGDANWMETWTMFIQAWVISSSSIVGVFIAYISRGRSTRELILFSLVVPIGYCIFWFCVWGGIGLRQSRQALELLVLGQTYFNNSAHFLVDGSEVCFNVPQDDIQVDGEAIFTNFLPGVTPVCMMDAVNYRAVPFNVLNSFTFPDTFGGNGLGNFLCFLFLFCCSIFFVAVADSSTFVVDCIASNGRKNFHWSRRLIWACTTGVQASLIISSRTEPVTVLKPIIFLCCFPLTILIAYLAQSIVLLCEAAEKIEADDEEEEAEYLFPNQPEFGMPIYGGVFNTMEYVLSFGRVNPARVEKQMHRASTAQIVEFIKGLVVPFISLNQILSKAYPQNPKTNTALVACYGVCYTAFVSVSIASVSAYPGLLGMAWTLLLVTGIQLAVVRSGFRSLYNVRSNYMADVTCSLLFWPQVLSQMRLFDESVATATGSVTVRLKQQENLKMLGIEEEVEEDDNEWTDATKNNKKVRDGKDLSKNDKYDDTGSSMLEV